MSKHSLISTGLGLGLMAASMGASAQLHTFDYSMMYAGSVSGGIRYIGFLPTIVRATTGAAGVLMVDMLQPASGTASTWTYAIAGAVTNTVAGGSGATFGDSITINDSPTYEVVSLGRYLGDATSISLSFSNQGTYSSQVCSISFAASIGTNDVLQFTNINVYPRNNFMSANANVSVTYQAGTATSSSTIASSNWNNASDTYASLTGTSASVSLAVAATTDTGYTTVTTTSYTMGTSAYNNLIKARNACVTAYNQRKGTGGNIVNSNPTYTRLW